MDAQSISTSHIHFYGQLINPLNLVNLHPPTFPEPKVLQGHCALGLESTTASARRLTAECPLTVIKISLIAKAI